MAEGQRLITGALIKNNTVTGKDVRDRSLRLRDLAPGARLRGPRGAQGVPGAQGAQGPQGAPGPQGPAGATRVVVRFSAEALGTATANCQPGERAVGGGGETGAVGGYLWLSRPSTPGTPTGWEASAASAADATLDEPVAVRAYVVCAAP